jgi:hypothetical protein
MSLSGRGLVVGSYMYLSGMGFLVGSYICLSGRVSCWQLFDFLLVFWARVGIQLCALVVGGWWLAVMCLCCRG